MSSRIARIYESPEEGANIIGFSRSAGDAVEDPRFEAFFAQRGYAVKVMPMKSRHDDEGLHWFWDEPELLPEGGVSYTYVEIRPPLTKNHIREFGRLCVGTGAEEGIIDPYHNNVYVVDNRDAPPDRPMGSGTFVAQG